MINKEIKIWYWLISVFLLFMITIVLLAGRIDHLEKRIYKIEQIYIIETNNVVVVD